jgi:hypothetical protein
MKHQRGNGVRIDRFAAEKRETLERWAGFVLELVAK